MAETTPVTPVQMQSTASQVGIDWTVLQTVLKNLSPYLQQVIIFLITHYINNPVMMANSDQYQLDQAEVVKAAEAHAIPPSALLQLLSTLAPFVAKMLLALLQHQPLQQQ